MLEGLIGRLSSINISSQIVSKLLTTIVIIVSTIIILKLLNTLLSRWQRKFISGLQKKVPTEISSIETKITISRRIINVGIYFFAFVFFLLQFEAARSLGTGLLASAGLAGIVIGMAAQNTFSNIIAGISISFSQPVRLNDAVIFGNEFGWVEEISLTHTVIRTWDNRRIMVPNSVLVNQVIQNWTIKDPSLLGVVMVYVDYACDVDKVRKWVKDIVDASPYSTKESVAAVQVVDFTEKSMVLRILGKGPDAPNTWDLRCEIREKLIQKFKQEGMPLPQIRIRSEDVHIDPRGGPKRIRNP